MNAAQLITLAASLAAILGLALMARMLGLGGGSIASEDEARATAEALLSGFESAGAAVASDGRAALVTGADGSLAVLKLHGAQVAARRLQPPFAIEETDEGLRIGSGEARFGSVLVRGVRAIPSAR